jgi:hypothetical protein
MKIFSSTESNPPKTPGKITGKSREANTKKPMSESDIREKLAANTEISTAAKQKSIQATQKLGDGFMKTDDHVLKSDVQLNSPEDPVTGEKLKSILSSGAFNFNPKERDVLSKILAE